MEVSKATNQLPKTGVLNRVTGTGDARDEAPRRGDLLRLGVSPPGGQHLMSAFYVDARDHVRPSLLSKRSSYSVPAPSREEWQACVRAVSS